MYKRSRLGILAMGGIVLGLVIVLVGVIKMAGLRDTRYAPLVFIGLAVGIVSTPFYYYFKADDKIPFRKEDDAVEALAAFGEQLKAKKQAEDLRQQIERSKKDNI